MNWILYVERALRWICIILFTVLVTIVSLQVISRLLTGKSFTVVEELSMFLLAWSTFMCAAYAARKKAHVRVEYFTNKYLSEKGRNILAIVLSIVVLLMMAVTVWASFGFVARQMKVSMVVLPFSKGLMYLSFPVGMLFLILFLIDDTVRTFKQLREGTTKTEEG